MNLYIAYDYNDEFPVGVGTSIELRKILNLTRSGFYKCLYTTESSKLKAKRKGRFYIYEIEESDDE